MRFDEGTLYEMERLSKSAGFQAPEILVSLIREMPGLIEELRAARRGLSAARERALLSALDCIIHDGNPIVAAEKVRQLLREEVRSRP